MNPLPDEMINRWEDRPELGPGEGLIYWHMLLGGNPDVVALAKEAQQRLEPFPGLHMTPLRWLHMTALIAGSASEFTRDQIEEMAVAASRLLANVPPISVTVGKILYHPEAIMLAAEPGDALAPVLNAVREATREVTGSSGMDGNKLPWRPHITIAYSTSRQPAGPIVTELGSSLPRRKVQINSVSVVNQIGAERTWDWHPEATVRFGSS